MNPARSPQTPFPTVQHTAEANGSPVDERFILVGLHTCGDLGPTMLRVFSHCDRIVGLISVGCCYMKITCLTSSPEMSLYQNACSHNTASHPLCAPKPQVSVSGVLKSGTGGLSHGGRPSETGSGVEHSPTAQVDTEENLSQVMSEEIGYPLSELVRSLPNHSLSYEAREVACHALEAFRERLQSTSPKVFLTMHMYDTCIFICYRWVGTLEDSLLQGSCRDSLEKGELQHIISSQYCARHTGNCMFVCMGVPQHSLRRSQVRISKSASKLPFKE